MSNERENGWNEYSKLVLKELETLSDGIQACNIELQEVRKDILRLEAKESKVEDLKVWKDKVDEIWSPSQMQDFRNQIITHEKFKTKAVTIFAVVQFLMAAALFMQKFV
mgnify:CR=1 FL=1|jgi:hypothetical protein|tara:strand:+ start:1988 stop:2314 length:327 start_codon:yes stop_codon:yes gene_type:complete